MIVKGNAADTLVRRVPHGAIRPGVRAMLGLIIAIIAVSNRAAGYCRSTNCSKCAKDADGCPSGKPIAWPTSCLTFSMHYAASKRADLATATIVTERAFAAWTGASCPEDGRPPSITIDHHFGEVACDLREYNQTDGNANIVFFHDDIWPYEGADNVLGLTTVSFKGGVIVDVDMELNSTLPLSVADPVPPTSYDLQSIVTHEAGHFLGMSHSADPLATMRKDYTAGSDSFRDLASDDVAGICAIYPPGQPAPCNANPDQGFSNVCGIFPSGNGGFCAVATLGRRRPTEFGPRWLAVSTLTTAIWLARRRARRR
jgi:hypothetical protein